MPRFDGTGPMGSGPSAGWGMGPCGAGMGWRRGSGQEFGWRRFYTKKEEAEMLKEEAEALEKKLKAVKERLAEAGGQN